MAQTTVLNLSAEFDEFEPKYEDLPAAIIPVSSVKRKEPAPDEEDEPPTAEDDRRPSKKMRNDEEVLPADFNKVDIVNGSTRDDPVVSIALEPETTPSTFVTLPGVFQFERLPPEVRSMIYRLLFVKENTAVRPLSHESRFFELPGTAEPPHLGGGIALLRTNRRINAEASETLYSQNKFILYSEDYGANTLTFLQAIGKRNLDAIRNVELDWQYGIRYASETSEANKLFEMISDETNPHRVGLAKMLHDLSRDSILKFAAGVGLFAGSPRLEHLTIVCPGTDNPGHPDNNCVEYRDCPGCHQEMPKAMVRVQGLKSLTVGDADWYNELEALGNLMHVEVINVTQVDCIDMSPESVDELKKQGWSFSVVWRDPQGEDFKRVVSKRLIDAKSHQ
ncbi:MAG: hypothetical protein M4579_007108 [Chaenotheca gracillima]|nr:MAG: hypothetical protein M4579_007108 [Chaenotheca gracillima]